MNAYYQYALTKGYYNADARATQTLGQSATQEGSEDEARAVLESAPVQSSPTPPQPEPETQKDPSPPMMEETNEPQSPTTQSGDSSGGGNGTTVNIYTGGLGSTTGTYGTDTVSVDVPTLDIDTGTDITPEDIGGSVGGIGGGGGFGGAPSSSGKKSSAPPVKTIIPLAVIAIGLAMLITKPLKA